MWLPIRPEDSEMAMEFAHEVFRARMTAWDITGLPHGFSTFMLVE